jgi:hypothetical protein
MLKRLARRMIWIAIALSGALPRPVTAEPSRRHLVDPAGSTHYIEFLARPTSCLVGHSFVQIGTVTRKGSLRPDVTLGLYPALYPRMDREALVNASGRLMKTPADTRNQATVRYRIDVSEATYRKAMAHARRISVEWRRYDLLSENCNKVLFEFADRLGLEVRRDMMDLPGNIVSHLEIANGGRTRASWRPDTHKR